MMSVVLSKIGLFPVDFVVFRCVHQLFFYAVNNLCCHAYGSPESKGFICFLCIQFSLYVAYLQLPTVIIRNIIVYPTFQVHSHVPFVVDCLVWGKNRIYIGDHSPQPDLWVTQSRFIYPLKLCIAYDAIPVNHFVNITGIPVQKGYPKTWRNWFIMVCQFCGFKKIPVVPFHKILLQLRFTNICFVTHGTGESEVILHGTNLYIIRT